MTVTRRGGISGKECVECKTWKMLGEFPPAPGKFKGYMKPVCTKCTVLAKNEQKRKDLKKS